ncbi:MAG: NifU family protein [Lachnospiraceae bacterium]|nr:NifU family protein [Lachnospiraceae bacterium]
MSDSLRQNIEQVLDLTIRPQLKLHNGDVAISDISDDMVLSIKLYGECTRCAAASSTLDDFIKVEIMNQVPGIKDVVLDDSVPQDMLDMAKKILSHKI